MTPAIYTIFSVIAVSLISLIGLATVFRNNNIKRSLVGFLVSFSIGALLGDVFIHLLPELAEEGLFDLNISLTILGTILAFFVIEKYVHWHHHYTDAADGHAHPVVWTNILGDGVHNLIDGMVIAGAYLLDIQVGIATTIAVMLHEIPQEIGDFGILIYGGLTRNRALFYNFLSALTSLLGAVVVLTLGTNEAWLPVLAAIGSGSFIYIALADLTPELHKENKFVIQKLLTTGLGIAVMFALLYLE